MVELGSKFEFIINKIENNTFYVSQVIQNNSDLAVNSSQNSSAYDGDGAARYIVVVVLVYGFSIIFFIGSQVRSTKKITDDVDGVNAEKVLRSMETEIFSREVLQKLSDKHLREKAWIIYVKDDANTDPSKEIERIESKIRMNSLNNQSSFKKDLSRKLSKFSFNRNDLCKDHFSDSELVGNSTQNKSSNTPLLVLQTDEDGLYKFKKSSLKKYKSLDDNEIKSNSSHKSVLKTSKQNESNSVTFDMFEITEQISTV